MKKRKITALLMSLVMVCSLTACGGKDTTTTQPEPAPAPAPADNAATQDTAKQNLPQAGTLHRRRTSRYGHILLEVGATLLRLTT